MATYQIPAFYMGEVSPRFFGRTDLPQYPYGCKTMTNAFPSPNGPVQKRPGTIYVQHAKDSNTEVGLIPFRINAEESAVLAFGDSAVTVMYEDGTSIDVVIGYPYDSDDVHQIDYVQLGEKMVLVHPDYKPRELTRTPGLTYSADSWAISDIVFTVTVTGFYVDFGAADGSGNNPSLVEFYDGRLIFASTTNAPGRMWMSAGLDFYNFTPPVPLAADDPITFDPKASKRAKIIWLAAEDALCFGTEDAPFRLGGPEILIDATQVLGWWPAQQGSEGGWPVKPVIAGGSIVYAQRGGQRLRAFAYLDATAKYMSTDMNMAADHILQAQVKKSTSSMAYQNAPFGIVWVIDNDGQLCSFVASPMSGSIGWSKYDFGGEVLSVCVVPTSGEDRVWISVDRGANGTSYEYLSPIYEDTVYTDQTIEYDAGASVPITAIADVASECNITSVGHGLADGTLVRLSGITDYAELDGDVYKVADAAADNFNLQYVAGTTYFQLGGAASSGGIAQPVINSASGLPYTNGDELQVVVDGSYTDDVTVAAGAISVSEYGRFLYIGRQFTTVIEPLDIPVAIEKVKRPYKLFARFYESYGLDAGPNSGALERFQFSTGYPYLDTPPTLSSEMVEINFPASGSLIAPIYMKSDIPLPLTIVSILIEFVVGR